MSMSKQAHAGPYFVVFMTTKFRSLAEAAERAPSAMSAHLARSQFLHAEGSLLMAGAFPDQPDQGRCARLQHPPNRSPRPPAPAPNP